jgi:mannose-1-phosphate guanylyltransferase
VKEIKFKYIKMIFVILCGGSGTRLWPLSRSEDPKQLHSLVTERTLLQDTVMRVKEIAEKEDSFYYFVTNIRIVSEVEKNIEKMGLSKDSYKILIEPVSRNSSPAILMASLFAINELDSRFQNQFVTVMSSDHAWDDQAFCQILNRENLEMLKDSIITLGIQPNHPHTGYGYIKRMEGSYKIEEFKEKPNLEMAKRYVESGQYLWNSGTFVFQLNTLLSAFEKYESNSFEIARQVYSSRLIISDQMCIFTKNDFEEFPNIAFDVAIMEKIQNGVVLPYHSIWSDIGSFDAVYDLADKDGNRNVIKGEKVLQYGTKNSYVKNETDKLVALVGLENIVVVQTEDAILIMNKEKCQDIKKIVEQLPEEYK